MAFGAKNGKVNGTEYIRFGRGNRTLIMLPGLGDGMRTVGGTALPMAVMYQIFAKDFTVYMFSRREGLPVGYTTRDMAHDLKDAMDALGIEQADILGVSMGGMIAQWLAIDYPDRVGKLILTVTAARPNGVLEESIHQWMEQARAGDHAGLMDSNLKRIYSEKYYRQNKWMIPLLGVLTRPKSYERFLILAKACLNHDAYAEHAHRGEKHGQELKLVCVKIFATFFRRKWRKELEWGLLKGFDRTRSDISYKSLGCL